MKRAQWMAPSAVEREIEVRRQMVRRHDRVALTVGAFTIAVAAIAGIGLAAVYLSGVFCFIAVVVVLVILFVATARIDRRRDQLVAEVKAADQILLDEFGTSDAWLVSVRISQGAAPTGDDRGIVWFEESRLYFSGHRTSFVLSGDLLDGPLRIGAKVPGLYLSYRIGLNLKTAGGPVSVSFEPSLADSHVFQGALKYWQSSKPSTAGQLPPTDFGPGTQSSLTLFRNAALSSFYWPLLLELAWLIHDGYAGLFIFILGASLGCRHQLAYPVARWLAWRDRLRLSRKSLSFNEVEI